MTKMKALPLLDRVALWIARIFVVTFGVLVLFSIWLLLTDEGYLPLMTKAPLFQILFPGVGLPALIGAHVIFLLVCIGLWFLQVPWVRLYVGIVATFNLLWQVEVLGHLASHGEGTSHPLLFLGFLSILWSAIRFSPNPVNLVPSFR